MHGYATHIVGGDMFYTYLGNNEYEVTLTVYRDCGPGNVNGTGFDENAQIGIYTTGNGNLYQAQTMNLGNAEVEWVPVVLENPCFILPPDVCVERAQYTEVYTLPPSASGYTLVYSRCCRNSTIVNLDTPQDQGTSIVTYIPGSANDANINNSARFVNFPPVALCANAEFYFDASATDEDGDSLVYSFCDPYLGGDTQDPAPFPAQNLDLNTVDWAGGFNAINPVTSNPQLSINPVTGQMTGTATAIGRYALAICVTEYRNGVAINTIMRDFQFNVTLCDPNIVASTPQQTQFCSGDVITFQNTSINSTFYHWDFGVPGIDSDTSNVEEPTYTFPASGSFQVMLVANPGWPCADTSISTFTSYPPIDAAIIVGEYECLNNLDYYNLSLTANVDATALYTWNFGPGSVPANSSTTGPFLVQMNPEVALTNISVTVTNNGCTDTDAVAIDNPPDPVAVIEPQVSFCDGLSYTFQNLSSNAVSYYWNFGDTGGDDFSVMENPEYTFNGIGEFNIMLVAQTPFACSDTSYMNFEIYGNLNPSFDAPASQCLEGNSFDFVAEGATAATAVYNWNFGASASTTVNTQSSVQNIHYSAPDWHTIVLTISENGCTESYTDSVWVVQNFENEFFVDYASNCPPVLANFKALSAAEVPVYYLWNFGDGTTSSVAITNHTYENPGTYDVSITASTLYACVESETVNFPNEIVVQAPPIAGFTISPQLVDILAPNVSVADMSQGGTSCYYFMTDGGESNDCNFQYSWSESGVQTITQVVTNEYGCVATASGQVIISGFLFFAPNAFTPNGDGVNDTWLPESTGVTSYHIVICNRWGEVVFETTDWTKPWTGSVHNGQYFAADGVYNYVVKTEDLVKLPHEYHGIILLSR